jgi:hypothetical protein
MRAINRPAITRCFLVVVIAGLAWRLLGYFLNFEMSIDESYIMNNVIGRSYGELLNPLDYAQVSPPGFLWATKLMDSLFRNEWGVRLLPMLAGLGAMAVFWGLCVEVLRGAARWVAWAIFSVSYVPVAEGVCAKGYTLDLLLAMLMFWLMLRWLRRGQRERELFWLALCAPVSVWFSYTSVFVIGSVSLVLLARILKDLSAGGAAPASLPAASNEGVRPAWRNAVAGLVFMALAGGSAIWLYQVNIRPSLHVSKLSGLQDFWQMGYPPLEHPWKIPSWFLEVHTGRGFAWPVGENHFGSTLTTVLWLSGLVVYWRRGNRWAWWLFVIPHLLLLTAAFLHKYPYGANPRICMFLGPGICLFMGAGAQHWLSRFGPERRRLCYQCVAMLLLIVAVGGAARDVVLRVREIKGPGIRSTLIDAGVLVGTSGQFVVLNPIRPLTRETSQVFAYYMSRYVAQPVWWNGEISPARMRPDSNLAVVAVTTAQGSSQRDMFGGFEKRFGKPMLRTWTQVGRMRHKTTDRVEVRIYHIGP